MCQCLCDFWIFHRTLFEYINVMATGGFDLFGSAIDNNDCNLFREYRQCCYSMFNTKYSLRMIHIQNCPILQIPETPLWLLSKNRPDDAQKSLQWLRGWVSKDVIAEEFNQLQRYSERSQSCNICVKQKKECTHQEKATLKSKFAELIRKRTLKPFGLVFFLFFLSQFTSMGMRPYIVQIFEAYKTPIQADLATVSSLPLSLKYYKTFRFRIGHVVGATIKWRI